MVNSWGRLLLLGDGSTFSSSFPQQEPRGREGVGWADEVECSCEVGQDINLVAEQSLAFPGHPSRKGGLNKEGAVQCKERLSRLVILGRE